MVAQAHTHQLDLPLLDMRSCRECRRLLPITAFVRNGRHWRHHCKACWHGVNQRRQPQAIGTSITAMERWLNRHWKPTPPVANDDEA